jgi:hypothetical protein
MSFRVINLRPDFNERWRNQSRRLANLKTLALLFAALTLVLLNVAKWASDKSAEYAPVIITVTRE